MNLNYIELVIFFVKIKHVSVIHSTCSREINFNNKKTARAEVKIASRNGREKFKLNFSHRESRSSTAILKKKYIVRERKLF